MSIEAIHRHPWLRATLLACGLSFAAAVPAQTLDFGSCVRIDEAGARLACYDRAAGRAPASAPAPAAQARGTAPAAAVTPVAPPPPARATPAPAAPQMPRDPVAEFGAASTPGDPLTAAKTREEPVAEVRQIEARVTAVRSRPEGQQVLTLDNGQVWTQTETRRDPRFSVGDVVIIKRGVLGSFLLTLQKGSASTRVKRIS